MNAITDYIGNPAVFPILERWAFFNHAGVAPIPKPAADAMRAFAAQAESAGYLSAGWYQDIEKLRQDSATLLNCHRDEIAFVKNTSEGISIVANGIDWQYGDRIVTTNVEYPVNIYPWMEVARGHGVKLVMVEETDAEDGFRHVPIDKILQAASEPRTRLVALSHVEFASGQRHDLARIGQFCAERKILFCIDAIQSLGILPVDVRAMHIDFLSADGHKWLLGPEGAGIFFCRRELIDHTRPLMIGWMNVVDAQNFGHYDYTLRPDAARFECGSHNVPGLLALKSSLHLLQSVGIPQVAQRIKSLGDLLITGLRTKGYKIISPRTAEQWSGIISFVSPTHSHEKIFQTLRKDHQIEIALRVNRLRCSPHFYNTEAQITQLIDALPSH
ncbi:MAG TPA: aminotransferase class V-fold PLP-dependent enzyme [Tepidisphaeraceae bacterium]|jgi:selenocysteine lyase/cysteine desulfurase|nr:aminotransferase class V-fold PLP-dependent enzyme [Tepidisphaeraceae bacterium]